jgi:hypothetical protein
VYPSLPTVQFPSTLTTVQELQTQASDKKTPKKLKLYDPKKTWTKMELTKFEEARKKFKDTQIDEITAAVGTKSRYVVSSTHLKSKLLQSSTTTQRGGEYQNFKMLCCIIVLYFVVVLCCVVVLCVPRRSTM